MAEDRLIGIDFSIASEDVIRMLLDYPSDNDVSAEILQANRQRPEILRIIYEHPGIPDSVHEETATLLSLPVVTSRALEKTPAPEEAEHAKTQSPEKILQRIQRLTIGEKIHLALKGGKELRNILIRDPNREVVLKVLENPKLTEGEVEIIARNPSVPEDALRYISKKRDWIRKYPILYSLVSNPKTPPGISMPYISRVRFHDLVILEKNKNISIAVRDAIKRYIKMKKQ